MHQGKLNLCQLISDSSGSRASIFTITGVKYEGAEDVSYLSRLTFLMYYSGELGWEFSGRERVMVASCWRYILCGGRGQGFLIAFLGEFRCRTWPCHKS